MHRRQFLMSVSAIVAAGPIRASASPTLAVAKSPTCGCCTAWVERMQQSGFQTDVTDVDQDELYAMKDRLGITPELAGCHTATIGGYFVEGHVPAEDIRRLLAEAPNALGITVPGMPMGAPGMDMGSARDAFDVLLVLRDGTTQTFASYS
jgi:hypothetical protein